MSNRIKPMAVRNARPQVPSTFRVGIGASMGISFVVLLVVIGLGVLSRGVV